ncbi:MAG TPA: Hsp20/alpha crystallin family protein, partial [Planctomycetaceae bacterium]|nr:Hsp20/alpha crystallin family protein [Planctomycetaceae bacterium]
AGLIDVVATQGNKAIDTLGLRVPGKHWIPNVDVVESAEEVLVFADVPGVEPDAVEILLTGNMLTIKGNRAAGGLCSSVSSHRLERPHGPFCRSIPLPVGVDPDKVSAESRHGVLTVRLAKEEGQKARQIPIGTLDR